jgi:hypothetical protein
MPARGVYRRRARERFEMDAPPLTRRSLCAESFLFSFLSVIICAQQARVSGNSVFWAPSLNQGTSVYTSIPHPHDLRPDMKGAGREPVFCKSYVHYSHISLT